LFTALTLLTDKWVQMRLSVMIGINSGTKWAQ